MARKYPGTPQTITNTFYSGSTPTDPTTITFKWRQGWYGAETIVTPTKIGTGIYSATITPSWGGNIYYRWESTGSPTVTYEGVINIAPTRFEVSL